MNHRQLNLRLKWTAVDGMSQRGGGGGRGRLAYILPTEFPPYILLLLNQNIVELARRLPSFLETVSVGKQYQCMSQQVWLRTINQLI